jgi:hypothetical protein
MPESTEQRGRWHTELYPRGAKSDLAAYLHDSGLLAQINSAVLHPQGLALGVIQSPSKEIVGLSLNETPDPEGIEFDRDATSRIRQKMRAAGLLRDGRIYGAGS